MNPWHSTAMDGRFSNNVDSRADTLSLGKANHFQVLCHYFRQKLKEVQSPFGHSL